MLFHVALLRTYVLPKYQILQEPLSVASQKTAFLTVTAVKTSNLTLYIFIVYNTDHLNRNLLVASEVPVYKYFS
jgi:hypothetical protein